MRDDQECRCYVEHLLAEHRRLHSLLRQMRASIARSLDPDEQPSPAEVSRILARLREELEHHFAEEEAGGCLDEAVSRCPRLGPEAQRIEAEHPQILAELDELAAQVQAAPTPVNRAAVQQGFDRLCENMRAHEKAENALLAQGFGVAVNGDDTNIQRPLILDI